MSNQMHPVWDVYDHYRSALLNVKYYSIKLYRLIVISKVIDGILLASAPTSSISAIFFFETPIGKIIWKYFGAIAAITAILKPLLRTGNKIKKYEEYLTGYRAYQYDLEMLKIDISQMEKYDSNMQNRFQDIIKRKKSLIELNPEYKENKRLKRRLVDEVKRELPVDNFYIP